jgi:hypothetical protein
MEGLVLEFPVSGALASVIAGVLFLLVIAALALGMRADQNRAAAGRAEPARKAA